MVHRKIFKDAYGYVIVAAAYIAALNDLISFCIHCVEFVLSVSIAMLC